LVIERVGISDRYVDGCRGLRNTGGLVDGGDETRGKEVGQSLLKDIYCAACVILAEMLKVVSDALVEI
jgi:hypothetical protein